jgi:hypothetical protein
LQFAWTKTNTGATGIGDTKGTITMYKSSGIDTTAPDLPTGNILNGWTEEIPAQPTLTESEPVCYIWSTVGEYTIASGSNTKVYGSKWEAAKLYLAYNSNGVDPG